MYTYKMSVYGIKALKLTFGEHRLEFLTLLSQVKNRSPWYLQFCVKIFGTYKVNLLSKHAFKIIMYIYKVNYYEHYYKNVIKSIFGMTTLHLIKWHQFTLSCSFKRQVAGRIFYGCLRNYHSSSVEFHH